MSSKVVTSEPARSEIPDSEFDADFQEMKTNNYNVGNNLSVFDESENSSHICCWEGCYLKFHNLDELVHHVTEKHIESEKPTTEITTTNQDINSSDNGILLCHWEGCDRKGKPFSNRESLISHMRIHTGEAPFYCTVPECQRRFTRHEDIQQHLLTAHELSSPQGIAGIREALRRKTVQRTAKYESAAKFQPTDPVDTSSVLETISQRMAREKVLSVEGYNGLIDNYCSRANHGEVEQFLEGPVAELYRLQGVKFNPAVKDNVYKETRLALSNYNIRHKALETGRRGSRSGSTSRKPASVTVSLRDVDESTVDDIWGKDTETLKRNAAILESYKNKLAKLSTILDSQVKQTVEESRLWWLKKETLLEAILKNDGVSKEAHNDSQ